MNKQLEKKFYEDRLKLIISRDQKMKSKPKQEKQDKQSNV